jgi:hypothetical protein
MRLFAIGAAAQLPHDGETFVARAGDGKIVGELQEAFEKPAFAVIAVVRHHRFGVRCARADQPKPGRGRSGEHMAAGRHGGLLTLRIA